MILGGRYKVLKPLGKGGEGSVYLAVNESAGKLWAVKVIEQKKNPQMREELELWKQLSHPGLPEVVDVIEEEGRLILVMDYIPGRSVAGILREKGDVSSEQVIEWGIEISRVLSYLHEQTPPVIYGDLKPANLICRKDGSLALVDFGSLRTEGRAAWWMKRGTRGFVAPEQYEGNMDVRSDIYSMGVTLFQMVTGQLPGKLNGKAAKILRKNRELTKVIKICIRMDPDRRFRNCRECESAFQRIKKSKRRQRLLILASIISVSGSVFSLGSQYQAKFQKKEDEQIYESLLERAKYNLYEEQVTLCKKAIFYDPTRDEAYHKLLETFLADDILSKEEELSFRKLLLEVNKEGTTFQEAFRGKKKGYALFSYEMGIAYHYYYEGSGGKSYAVRWFQDAAGAREDKSVLLSYQKQAEIFARIGSYYDQIHKSGSPQAAQVSYRNYWEDLTGLLAIPSDSLGSHQVELMLWEEISGQICSLTDRFLQEGVTKAEMKKTMGQMEEYLGQSKNEKVLQKEREQRLRIMKNIKAAGESMERIAVVTKEEDGN